MFLEPLILLQAVREVSELANPASPAEASQRAFDKARARSSRFPDLPAARNIAAILNPDTHDAPFGEPMRKMSWREVLELAHEPSAVQSHRLGRKQAVPKQDWLTEEHIGFVLKYVARRLGLATLTLSQYRIEREKLLAVDHASWLHGRQLRLPTDQQIRFAVGEWDKALVVAGLAPRPGLGDQGRGKYAASTVELLERCYEAHGTQPVAEELRVFAQANGIPYNVDKTRSWTESVADWKAKRRAKDLPVPDGFPPKSERPDYSRDVGAALPGEGRRHKWDDVEDCIACVLRYLEQLGPGQRSTASNYDDWAAGQDDAPGNSAFNRHGGWSKVRQQAQERLKSA